MFVVHSNAIYTARLADCLTSALDGVGVYRHAPAAFTAGRRPFSIV